MNVSNYNSRCFALFIMFCVVYFLTSSLKGAENILDGRKCHNMPEVLPGLVRYLDLLWNHKFSFIQDANVWLDFCKGIQDS